MLESSLRHKNDAAGSAARNCFVWDGEPDAQPIRDKPSCYPPNINVFARSTSELERQEGRELPFRPNGVKVYEAETLQLLKGEGGVGVDFAAASVPAHIPPRRPCALMWKWQNREKHLSQSLALRSLRKKEERGRVKARQGNALDKKQKLHQTAAALHGHAGGSYDALTGTNLTLCDANSCPVPAARSPREAASGPIPSEASKAPKMLGKRFRIAGSNNKVAGDNSPAHFMGLTECRSQHLAETVPGNGQSARLQVVENTKFITSRNYIPKPPPPPPKLGPAYNTKPYFYSHELDKVGRGPAVTAPAPLVKPCWIGRAPPPLSGTVQKEVDRVRWELDRLALRRRGQAAPNHVSRGRGGAVIPAPREQNAPQQRERPLSARVKHKIADMSEKFIENEAPRSARVRPGTAPTVAQAMSYQPRRPNYEREEVQPTTD